MEYPIPSHLKNYLELIGDENDEFKIKGIVKCKCGSKSFKIYESNNKMIVKVFCSLCNEELILFDEDKHGWNGFVCNDNFLNREESLNITKCSKCNNDKFEIEVTIASQGKEDFIDESCLENSHGETLNESDWVNAFEWISANITCLNCKNQDESWLHCEKM